MDERRQTVGMSIEVSAGMARGGGDDAGGRVRFLDVLRSRVFRALYLAETQSVVGDQLARVALSVLVFERTRSTPETALTYALTFLPAIAGGALLSGLGDRFAQRTVMVCCDLLRAGLLAAMAISGMPIGGLFALLTVVVFVGPAFTSAQVSMVAAVLDGERYRVATGLRMITNQLGQVAGFAVGGALVTVLNPRWALRVDACSFALSALVIAYGTRGSTAAAPERRAVPGDPGLGLSAVVRVLRADRHLWFLVSLTWLAGCFVVPEGLAAPYATDIGGSTAAVGILMTAIPAGSVVGAYLVLRRIPPAARSQVVGLMAVLTGLPLLACAGSPPLPVSIVLWFLSGVFAAYLLDVLTSVVALTPVALRGRVIGVVGAGLIGVQGLGLLVFGVVADGIGSGPAIAAAGGTGALLATWSSIALRRSEATTGAAVDDTRA
jgi:predicted MFS family arabinose efflux permease